MPIEPYTVIFTDPQGKTYTTTVHAADMPMAMVIVKEHYPWAQDIRPA